MIRLTTFILLFVNAWTLNLQAQCGTNDSRHSIGVQFAGYYSDTQDPGRQALDILIDNPQAFTNGRSIGGSPDLAYAIGFTYGYCVQPYLKIVSSLGISTMNYQFNAEVTSRNQTALENSDVEVWQLVQSVEGNNFLYFLETQFGIQLSVGGKRFRVFWQPYIETNFYLSNRQTQTIVYEDDYTVYNAVGTDEVTDFRYIYPAWGLGMGAEYRLSRHVDISAMGFIENFTENIDQFDNQNDSLRPSNAGINLKLSYRL